MDYEKGGLQKELYTEDEVVKRNCPLCGSKDGYWHIYQERGSIGIVRCKGCQLGINM